MEYKKTIIDIAALIGTDIRSRANANIIRAAIDGLDGAVLDLSGVEFVSRSFADELYNIITDNPTVRTEGAHGIVASMLATVEQGRSKPRHMERDDAEVVDALDMDSLTHLLMAT